MKESELWSRMWGESKFVPADASTPPKETNAEQRIEQLEKRVKSLELRLSRLSNI